MSVQKVLPHNFTAQVGYVGNRQNDMVRNQNLNYSQIGGGNAGLPFNQPGLAGGFRTTAQVNTVRPLGRVQYDSLQVSINRRMNNGFAMTSAYTLRQGDRLVGRRHPDPGVLAPQQGHQGGNTPHKVDISATYELPFGPGRKYASNGGVVSHDRSAAGRSTRTSQPSLVRRSAISASNASLNANSPQRADQVKEDVEILGGIGVDNPYFDPTAFKPVTEARFGTAGFNTLRGPGYANLDLSVFRTFRLKASEQHPVPAWRSST